MRAHRILGEFVSVLVGYLHERNLAYGFPLVVGEDLRHPHRNLFA